MKPRLLILFLLAALPVFGQQIFYRSNESGMKLERIEPYQRGESAWVLA